MSSVIGFFLDLTSKKWTFLQVPMDTIFNLPVLFGKWMFNSYLNYMRLLWYHLCDWKPFMLIRHLFHVCMHFLLTFLFPTTAIIDMWIWSYPHFSLQLVCFVILHPLCWYSPTPLPLISYFPWCTLAVIPCIAVPFIIWW